VAARERAAKAAVQEKAAAEEKGKADAAQKVAAREVAAKAAAEAKAEKKKADEVVAKAAEAEKIAAREKAAKEAAKEKAAKDVAEEKGRLKGWSTQKSQAEPKGGSGAAEGQTAEDKSDRSKKGGRRAPKGAGELPREGNPQESRLPPSNGGAVEQATVEPDDEIAQAKQAKQALAERQAQKKAQRRGSVSGEEAGGATKELATEQATDRTAKKAAGRGGAEPSTAKLANAPLDPLDSKFEKRWSDTEKASQTWKTKATPGGDNTKGPSRGEDEPPSLNANRRAPSSAKAGNEVKPKKNWEVKAAEEDEAMKSATAQKAAKAAAREKAAAEQKKAAADEIVAAKKAAQVTARRKAQRKAGHANTSSGSEPDQDEFGTPQSGRSRAGSNASVQSIQSFSSYRSGSKAASRRGSIGDGEFFDCEVFSESQQGHKRRQ